MLVKREQEARKVVEKDELQLLKQQ